MLKLFVFKLIKVENTISTYEPHAAVVVYSVTDRSSFRSATDVLRYLWQEGITRDKSVILVGNKCDLARARVISSQGNLCGMRIIPYINHYLL